MRKIISILAIALFTSTFAFAQTTTVQKTTVATNKQVDNRKKTVKKEVKKSTTKLKADGTPDMRYKVNKTNTVVSGPKKKDGTADMRYKANKAAAKKN